MARLGGCGTIQCGGRNHPNNPSGERLVERQVPVQVAVVERAVKNVHDQLRVAAGSYLASRERALDDGPAFPPDPVNKTLAPGNRQIRITLYFCDEVRQRTAPTA